ITTSRVTRLGTFTTRKTNCFTVLDQRLDVSYFNFKLRFNSGNDLLLVSGQRCVKYIHILSNRLPVSFFGRARDDNDVSSHGYFSSLASHFLMTGTDPVERTIWSAFRMWYTLR